jgi:endonuclease YncB( thermonuclease family)
MIGASMPSRRNSALVVVALITAMAACPSLYAQQATEPKAKIPVFDIALSGVTFETGDTWSQGGEKFRLYGVQSCIRGATFTNAAGAKGDCGEASLAYFAALIRDTKPRCTTIARAAAPPLNYAVCAAHIGQTSLDLGTILITQGFAFAAADAHGRAVNLAYAVAEADAKANRRGLWASTDLPHPNAILARAARRIGGPAEGQ